MVVSPEASGSATQATPEPDGRAAVVVAKPAATPLVAIPTVTMPGAMLFGCEVAAVVAAKNTLVGKLVPLNSAFAKGVAGDPPVNVPVVMIFAGFLSIRNRPSPWVPASADDVIVRTVDPVVHPEVQFPKKTAVSSAMSRSKGCVPSSAESRVP